MELAPLLTVKEVVARLQVSYLTVLRLIKRGKLKASKISKSYRIDPADLAAFIQQAKTREN